MPHAPRPTVALVYDFDGTLAPGNMQERDFIPKIRMKSQAFWDEVSQECEKHRADNILMYMRLMLVKAAANSVEVRKEDFKRYGRELELFRGICPEVGGKENRWFRRINKYGAETGVNVEHYIVSSGIGEMIQGSPIAKEFKKIYASSFYYDHHGIAVWPALALNYTTKTQYIFRINKGCLDIYDHREINEFVREEDRPIPFQHMVYIGDGDTDVPCFRLVKSRGGYSVAVHQPGSGPKKQKCETLLEEGRVNFVAPANYESDKKIDRIVKRIIDKIASDAALTKVGP